jgi:hypothetical protein
LAIFLVFPLEIMERVGYLIVLVEIKSQLHADLLHM